MLAFDDFCRLSIPDRQYTTNIHGLGFLASPELTSAGDAKIFVA